MRARDTREPGFFSVQLLIILFTTLFLGGGAAELPDHVQRSVSDAGRREAAVGAAKAILSELEATSRAIAESRRALYAELERPPLSEDRMRELFARFDERMAQHAAAIVEARFRMRDAMTADEWDELFRRLDEAAE